MMLARRQRFPNVCAVAFLVAAIATNAPAVADDFTPEERASLEHGGEVVQLLDYARGAHRYVGGLSYRVVSASPDALSTILRDVSRYAELFTNLSSATLQSISPTGLARVRVEHKFGPFSGGYTLMLAFTDEGKLGRFWVDATDPGVLGDGWGFFRLTPLAPGGAGEVRTLVTYAVLFELSSSVLRTMFEPRIQRIALSFPSRLADAARRP